MKTVMANGNMSLKQKLNSGKRVYGTAVVSASTLVAEVVRQAELDFVFLDTEHVPLGRETVAGMCALYTALGIAPMVRIPSADPDTARMVLDGGATAILAPYVESPEQVRALAGAVKYRPLKGKKLQQILDGKESVDGKLKYYVDERCREYLLLINIESLPALDQLEGLLSVPGLDGVVIGPHDLSCSMGIPEDYTHPAFEKAVIDIIRACQRKKLGIGIHLSEEYGQQIKWAKKGVNIILHSWDISLLGKILHQEISAIKSALGDAPGKAAYPPVNR
jgi:4-hydroxy-2-oxoheptanedioate aldolase